MHRSTILFIIPIVLFLQSFLFLPFSFLILLLSIFSFVLSLYFLEDKQEFTLAKWSIPIKDYQIILFSLVCFFSIFTLKNYFQPSLKSNTFNNVDHTTLIHHGFEFEENLALSSTTNKQNAIFTKFGEVHLEKRIAPDSTFDFQLTTVQNSAPVYVSQNGLSGNRSEYKLMNFESDIDLQDGFTLSFGDEHTYTVTPTSEIGLFDKITFCVFGCKTPKYQIQYTSPNETIIDTTNVTIKMQYGISLKDFLLRAESIPLPEALDSLFHSSYLIRSEVFRDTEHERYDDQIPALVLFPGDELRSRTDVSLTTPQNTSFSDFGRFRNEIDIPDNHTFYIGFRQKAGNNGTVFKIQGGNPFGETNNKDTIRFEFPQKYALDSKADLTKSFFINSDTKDILNRDYSTGFFYNFNPDDDFSNHVRASFGYIPGNTKEQLHFLVTDHNNLKNDQLEEPISENIKFRLFGKNLDSYNWIFEFKNFKSSFPYSTKSLLIYLLGISFCLLGLFFLFHRYNSEISKTEKYYNILFIVFSLLIFVITFRYFLSWRIGVFPPLENISLKEFQNLRLASGIENTNFGFILLFMFFVAQLIYNSSKFNLIQFLKKNKLVRTSKVVAIVKQVILGFFNFSGKMSVFMMFLSSCILILAIFVMSKFSNGLIGLVFAVFYFILANLSLSHRIHLILESERNKLSDKNNRIINQIFIRKWFLFFATSFSILIIDKGFFIIIFFLGALYVFVERYLLARVYAKQNANRKPIWSKYGLALSISLLGFLLLAKPIIKGVTYLGITELSPVPAHFDFRSKIFSNGLKDVVQNTDFGNTDKIHLLRAAHNKWFIQNYYWLQEDQSLFTNFFKLQPHSNRGVPFITQTSDLVSLRYIISEHSELFLIALIIFLVALFWIFLKYLNFKNPFHMGFLAIWYFIVVRSIFVWMTVTNKIVFFGQDFPFFSINSRLIFWFTLMLLGLLPFFYSLGTDKSSNRRKTKPTPKIKVNKMQYLPIGLLSLVVVLYGADRFFQSFNDKEQATQSFNIAPNLQEVKSQLYDVNSEFSRFQKKKYPNGLPSSVSPSELVKEYYTEMSKDNDSDVAKAIKPNKENLFTTSVISNFFDSSGDKTSLNNLIYTYRANNGEYRFKLRSDFFTIPSIQSIEKSWKGSVLSAPVFSEYTLILNDSIPSKELDWNKVQKLDLSSKRNSTTKVEAVSYPKSWTNTDRPLLFFWSEGRGSSSEFSISNGIFSYSSAKDDTLNLSGIKFPLAMSPLDYINTTERSIRQGGNYEYLNTRYEIVADKDQYLAKNIWLNGKKNKFIYPMSYKNIWPYHIAEMAKSKFTDSLAIDDVNVKTTIDYGLHDEVFKIVANHNQNHNFSLVALDGDAKVRLLFDYKKSVHDADDKLDPNNEADFYKVLAGYERVNNTLEERDLFGNLCLLKMSPGPGSSFKPITFSSVIPGYNFPWNSMSTASPTAETLAAISDEDFVRRYAGHPIQKWKNLGPTEIRNPQQFLSRSSNYYNSILMFSGSYNEDAWASTANYIRSSGTGTRANDAFLIRSDQAIGYSPDQRFPVIRIGAYNYYFDKDRWPRDGRIVPFKDQDGSLFSDENAVLPRYLSENYTFSIKSAQEKSDKKINGNLFRSAYDLYDNSTGHKLWAFPEASTFIQLQRQGDGNDDYMSAGGTGLRQPTVGGDPLITTPIKMAENALRLYTLDKGKQVSIVQDSLTLPRDTFIYNADSYNSENQFFRNIQSTIYAGMYRTLSEGTGRSLIGATSGRYNYSNGRKGYHFYVKTGTLGVAGQTGDLKALMVIISEDAIHLPTYTIDQLSENKVYSLYFTFYSSPNDEYAGWMKDIVRRSVEKVIDSKTFKAYWNEN